MDAQQWQRLKTILAGALEERSPAARSASVEESCADDVALLHHTKSLLAEAESLLRDPIDDIEECAERISAALGRDQPSRIGERIGQYVVVRELGQGGMGAVYLAKRADGSFEKEVAIKLLKRGTDTDEVLRRFRAERQVLARLDHPNIARLLDAGMTSDGLPYFVMEYVAGMPVTEYVSKHQLSIEDRLALFIKICRAVEMAHRNLVVHRDLKPGNIWVNTEGEPKLLDFGIAKLLAPGDNALEVTATGQQRLTPISASPEQARGEPVTIASDVYALGALLYEMVTGQSPHRFSTRPPSREELMRVVCDTEPALPSLVAGDSETRRSLRGDLDNIVLFAMRKEQERRYSSVVEFAEDIQRHIAGRPVRARPRTVSYRFQRFLARNRRPGLAVAWVGILLLAAGLVFFTNPKLRKAALDAVSPETKSAPPITEKSIAVLPFETLDNNNDNGYFVDGVQDNVLTDLAKVSDLRVIGRSAVTQYRNRTKDAREIGRLLGVAHVLEGTVQKSIDRVRVNVRLIDTRTNAQVWAEHYERNVDDLFALQSELAQTIVAQLSVTLLPSEKAAIESRPTQDMEAYDLYLRARDLIRQFGVDTGESKEKAIRLLDSAIARDPKFTLAYCLQCEAHIMLYRYFDHTPARLARAKESAAMALQLAPNLGESHLAQARYYYHGLRDYVRTQKELDLAAPTLSGDAEFLALAEINERRLGHWKDSLRDGAKALSLDPRDPVYASTLIESYIALRRFSEADKLANNVIAGLPAESTGPLWGYKVDSALAIGDLKRARLALEATPSTVRWKAYMLALVCLYERNYTEAARILQDMDVAKKEMSDYVLEGRVQHLLNDPVKAQTAFERARDAAEKKLREQSDDPRSLTFLGLAHAGLGRKEDALSATQRATELLPISHDAVDGPNYVLMIAEVYAWSTDPEGAIKELAKVARQPSGPTYGDLLLNPVWDGLRGDARFEKILAQAMDTPIVD